jgi:hypothetical protein
MKLTAEEAEAFDVHSHIHSLIDSLVVSGVEERGALAAIHLATAERALFHLGREKTVAWLREMAGQIEQHGDALLAGMKS